MPLQYQLYTPLPVPKLDSMTFLIGYDSPTIMLYSHRVHPMTVAGELQQTLAELRAGFTGSGYIELPKPERLVNRAWHQSLAIRRKRDRAGGGAVPSKTVQRCQS